MSSTSDDDRARRWADGTANGPAAELEVPAGELCMDNLLISLARAGLDRIDAAIADYHAARVPDPQEALWRTDYTRARMRWDLAEDRPYPGHPDAVWLRERASEIQARWATDPVVAPRWAELHHLNFSPYDVQGAELPSMPGEAPPGMDPVTWRSQLQARDLAGHARWPETTTTINREGTEPVNDTTRAADGANPHETESETETWTEQQMRADYMQAQPYRPDDPAAYDPADSVDYAEYMNRWANGDQKWSDQWFYLGDPDSAAAIDRNFLSPVQQRSEDQARYIAEHGIERDETGRLTSHYVTRVEDRRDAEQAMPSQVADYRPGNAVAQRLANTERDGIDR
ncbi:hypothetical protein [Nocardia sp. alder85J]|uniref:hypothetical protein n=1 Tax=Nocardia sp. alder85J TaxID=2862949 RepID=UPI001CD46589|nr:hypothetical protein [Nocardia sp. alder85J]MCX4094829.1 hypothetical protein [Nocardia sp. alder85J]